MPSTMNIECMKCEHIFEWFFHAQHYQTERINSEAKEKGISCPNCDNCSKPKDDSIGLKFSIIKTRQFPRSFIINESHRGGESAKPDSYFANAESERKRKLAKRLENKLESEFYSDKIDKKDKDVVAKVAREQINVKKEGG